MKYLQLYEAYRDDLRRKFDTLDREIAEATKEALQVVNQEALRLKTLTRCEEFGFLENIAIQIPQEYAESHELYALGFVNSKLYLYAYQYEEMEHDTPTLENMPSSRLVEAPLTMLTNHHQLLNLAEALSELTPNDLYLGAARCAKDDMGFISPNTFEVMFQHPDVELALKINGEDVFDLGTEEVYEFLNSTDFQRRYLHQAGTDYTQIKRLLAKVKLTPTIHQEFGDLIEGGEMGFFTKETPTK